MMCYKDITFCKEETCANFGDKCFRSLTAQVKADAQRWWGEGDAPIAVFIDRPKCYKREAIKDERKTGKEVPYAQT